MNKFSTILCFIILLSGLSTPLKSQTPAENLSQELSAAFKKSSIPGMAVSIVNKDKVLYQNEFGYADIDKKTPYTQHTIHNIGSTTKTFIGISIMQLVEQGKLTLDTKVNDILPFTVTNPYHPETPITIRQLATHTSSIKDRTFNYGLRAFVSDDDTKGNRKGLPFIYKVLFKKMLKNESIPLAEFLENTLSTKGKWYKKKNFYKKAPGTTEEYTNIGAALAGYIVEIVSGEKYEDYVVNRILQPLKLEATGWHKESTNSKLFAKRYVNGKAVPDYHLVTYPDGGLISSNADLSTYLMAMIKGYYGESDLLTPQSFKLMMQNQYEIAPLVSFIQKTEGRSGIFWDIFAKEGNGDIGHNGSDPGILTFLYFDPISGIGCLLKTNTDAEDKNMKAVIEIWELLIKHREMVK